MFLVVMGHRQWRLAWQFLSLKLGCNHKNYLYVKFLRSVLFQLMCHISGHQDVYVTSTVVTDQIYFPRTLTDGSGAPTSVPCLQQTPAEVSMTGLIREAWEFNNRITERRSSSTETQSPAWLCSTTIMEMVSELLLFNCEWAVSGKFYKLIH